MDQFTRFNLPDRRFLTLQRGISDGVVNGLEALGVTSIEALAAIAPDVARQAAELACDVPAAAPEPAAGMLAAPGDRG